MIKYVHEDIFNLKVDVLVIPINCVGVMGKGLALQFKNKYFDIYKDYRMRCIYHDIHPSNVYYYTAAEILPPKEPYNPNEIVRAKQQKVILLPTKDDWRDLSDINYIVEGLLKFAETYEQQEITSVAFPKLGCGCGGLDWNEVKPWMEKILGNLPIDVYICV